MVTGDRSAAVVIASNLSLAQLLLSTSTCRRVLPELLNQTSLTDQPPKRQARLGNELLDRVADGSAFVWQNV